METIQTAGVVPHYKETILTKDGLKIHKDFCGAEDEIPADIRCDYLDKKELELAFIQECKGKKTCKLNLM
jgi:hypothetical protein